MNVFKKHFKAGTLFYTFLGIPIYIKTFTEQYIPEEHIFTYQNESIKLNIRQKLLWLLFDFLQLFFRQNTYILLDCFFDKNAECLDSYSLFLYMQEQNIPSYYVVWRENYFYETLKNQNKLKNIIVVDACFGADFIEKAFWKLLKTKIIISAFLNYAHYTKEKAFVQNFIDAHNKITHVYLNHGVVFFKKDILDDYTAKHFDKLIVSNDIEKEIYKKYAGWDIENTIQAGLARWDFLQKHNSPEKTIFVFFTFRKTFAYNDSNRIEDFDYHKKIQSFFNNPRLQKILETKNIKLIYGIHHAISTQIHLQMPSHCKNIEIAEVHHISKYISKTDLLITDYSSIAFDFMFLDIPVVYYKIDFNDTKLLEIDKRSIDTFCECEPYLHNVIDDEEKLIDTIENFILTSFSRSSEELYKNKQFFYIKKDIAKTIYTELEKITDKPSSNKAKIYLAQCALKKGKFNKAFSLLKEAEQLSPHWGEIQAQFALLYYKKGELVEAIEYAQKAHLLDPYIRRHILLLTNLLRQNKNFEEALAFTHKIDAQIPHWSETQAQFSMTYDAQGDLEKAIKYAQKALVLDPSNRMHTILLANLLRKKGDYKKVLELMSEAELNMPQWSEPQAQYAMIYEAKGELDKALECAKKALAIAPENTLRQAYLNYILDKQKKTKTTNTVI